MCAAFYCIDIVYIRMQTFTIACIVHDGTFNGGIVFFGIQINDIINQRFVVTVQETYKLFHSFVRMEYFFLEAAIFFFDPAVGQ